MKCKIKTCPEEAKLRGWCKPHYGVFYRAGKIKSNQLKRNEIIIKGDIAYIQLYNMQGAPIAKAIIDAEDIFKIKDMKWCYNKDGGGYVCHGNKTKLHWEVMGKKRLYDHKDGNPLNNRKCNLRPCTTSQNNMNKTKMLRNNTSGYKGVYKGSKNRWRAEIKLNSKKIRLGYFKTKEEAAKVYNEAAIKYHGEFATLNNL